MEYINLFVNERPYCCWDFDLKKTNLEYINNISSEYFDYIAQIGYNNFYDKDNKEQRQYDLLLLQTTYYSALETLFALLLGSIQSPECIFGWMLKYTNKDLREIIQSINNGESINSIFKKNNPTWEDISGTIHRFILDDKEKENEIKTLYSKYWKNLSEQLLDVEFISEYNSIKHGFRQKLGGAILYIGKEKIPGKIADKKDMKEIGGSEFGSSFNVPINLENNKDNFMIKKVTVNWSPRFIIRNLQLISFSIMNIRSFLKIVNHEKPEEQKYNWPEDLSIIKNLNKHQPKMVKMSFKVKPDPREYRILSKKEIKDDLKNRV